MRQASHIGFYGLHAPIDEACLAHSLDSIHDLLNFLVAFGHFKARASRSHVDLFTRLGLFHEIEGVSGWHDDAVNTSLNLLCLFLGRCELGTISSSTAGLLIFVIL